MANYYFISDIHIGAGSKKIDQLRYSKLSSFFDYITKPENELFIVGDLFDFWFEYKHAVPALHYRYLFLLSKLIEGGVKVHFQPGNHDCWTRDFLSKELKIQIHDDIHILEDNNRKAYLFHGDGVLKKDHGYRLLKKIFKNRFNIFLYRWIHPDIGIPLASFMSHSSREHTSNREFKPSDDYIEFAKDKFSKGYDYVIIGHTHQPGIQKFGKNKFLNLGDWIEHFTYGLLDKDGLSMHYWDNK